MTPPSALWVPHAGLRLSAKGTDGCGRRAVTSKLLHPTWARETSRHPQKDRLAASWQPLAARTRTAPTLARRASGRRTAPSSGESGRHTRVRAQSGSKAGAEKLNNPLA